MHRNMQPLVVGFLRGRTFAELDEKHAVKARPCTQHQKFSLNYDQLRVKSGDVLAEQCRGLIVRPTNSLGPESFMNERIIDVQVVAWPMNRFYNLGDSAAHDVDWSDRGLQVYEKLDGTMCMLYYDRWKHEWHVATRSVPEADLAIYNGYDGSMVDHTFASLFAKAARATLQSLEYPYDYDTWLKSLNPAYTYVFELTTPINRVVVRYETFRITLLAVRETNSGVELRLDAAQACCGQVIPPGPTRWELSDPTKLTSFVNDADPSMLEGAVVLDTQFRRVKVKNKAWIASSKAKELVTVSRRNGLQVIIEGTIDDILPLVDDDVKEGLECMRQGLLAYIKHVDCQFAKLSQESQGDRKYFAEVVKSSCSWTTPYFQLFDKRADSMQDWIESLARNKKLSATTLDTLLEQITHVSI